MYRTGTLSYVLWLLLLLWIGIKKLKLDSGVHDSQKKIAEGCSQGNPIYGEKRGIKILKAGQKLDKTAYTTKKDFRHFA